MLAVVVYEDSRRDDLDLGDRGRGCPGDQEEQWRQCPFEARVKPLADHCRPIALRGPGHLGAFGWRGKLARPGPVQMRSRIQPAYASLDLHLDLAEGHGQLLQVGAEFPVSPR